MKTTTQTPDFVMFKTLKETGKHIVTLVKGDITYFMNNSPVALRSKLVQITFDAGETKAIDPEEEIIAINDITSIGKVVKLVDVLREKVNSAGSGLIEVTKEDLLKDKLKATDSTVLANTYSKLIKGQKELKALNKTELYEYVDSLGELGYDVQKISEHRTDDSIGREALIEEILYSTGKSESKTEDSDTNGQ